MTCRGFQYEEGKEYETDTASLCNSGFHACENPLDCLNYYAPNESVYHEVELDDNGERQKEDTKVVGKKIKIGAEIGLKGIIEAGVKFIYEKASENADNSSSGNYSSSASSGDSSRSASSGNSSRSASSGNYSSSASSGHSSRSASSGHSSRSASSGNYSSSASSGNYSSSASSGHSSRSEAKGKHCAAAALGKNVKVRASLGGGICATEYGNFDGEGYPLLAIKAAIVDGEKIKADTWYKLENGEFIEVKDEKS
jgi:hypothetical protein